METIAVAKGAYGIAFAADGTTWFTVAEGGRVGRIGPEGGEPVYWELDEGSQPTVIAVAPDGAAWFSEFKADRIGRVGADGELSEVQLAEGAGPYGIAVDRTGSVWFTESATDHIGRIGPDGALSRFAIPHQGGFPSAIALAPTGDLWFTLNAAASVGRVDGDGAVAVIPLALQGAAPVGIAAGASGVWFADIMGDRIGHLDADGTVTAIALSEGAKPHAVVADAEGGCWFTEWGGNRIGRVDADGNLTGHDLPVEASEPHGIAIAPDGAVWSALEIGELVRIAEGRLPSLTPTHPEGTRGLGSSVAPGSDRTPVRTRSGAWVSPDRDRVGRGPRSERRAGAGASADAGCSGNTPDRNRVRAARFAGRPHLLFVVRASCPARACPVNQGAAVSESVCSLAPPIDGSQASPRPRKAFRIPVLYSEGRQRSERVNGPDNDRSDSQDRP
ncbi:hypothetical protein [Glycomyces algeriensis]|uniref:Vgb family protein n=1 Tax=Glycomyces algeriensis TaxID=256037 RepID=UPI0022D82B34|nr:hypothetical protein [Glycomyces algeriensis]MDA1364944.1 hypothetical protein [Glycomyces algeriensis]MDR7349995.1 streptogramin lyase [Glycomyces algeriensis]